MNQRVNSVPCRRVFREERSRRNNGNGGKKGTAGSHGNALGKKRGAGKKKRGLA